MLFRYVLAIIENQAYCNSQGVVFFDKLIATEGR